jgi:hypothetical protein
MGTILILCCICNTQYIPYPIKSTPGQLVFGRDMVLPITFMADWGELNNSTKRKGAVTIEEKMPPR